jgi:arabinofuranan 3-O-arabinosyltransferase
VRLTVTRVTPGSGGLAAVRELVLPGVEAGRTLVLPAVPPSFGEPGSAVVLDVAAGGRDGCVEADNGVRCSPDLHRRTEDAAGLDRTLALPEPVDVALSARGRPRPGAALDALLDAGNPVRVTASSRAVADPGGRPGTVVDGDGGTGWVAADADRAPTLRLQWDGPRRVSGVDLGDARARLLAARAERVRITTAAGTSEHEVPTDGIVGIEPARTDFVVVRVERAEQLVDVGPGGRLSAVPVGFPEVALLGPTDLGPVERDPDARVTVPCVDGPVVTVGDRRTRFSASGTREDLLALRPLRLRPCGSADLRLRVGEQRVQAPPSATVDVSGLTLRVPPTPQRTRGRPVDVVAWGAEDRAVRVGPGGEQWLGVGEAFNRGWRATLEGTRLEPVRLDGWRQGWALPAGAGGVVRLEFLPGRVQSGGLVAGGVAVLVLLGLALLPGRPRPAPPPASAGRGPLRLLVLTGSAVLLGALAGWAGLALWAFTAALALRLPRALPLLAGGAMAAAGVLVASAPWGRFSESAGQAAPAQVLALTAVAAVVLSQVVSAPAAPAASVAAPAPRQRAG